MIIVFDDQCLLCNGWVRFLLRHDRRGVFQFASVHGESGKSLLAQAGLSMSGLQTLLLVDGSRSWQRTAAILRVLHALGWPWRAAWIAWLLPSIIRDCGYRWIARKRYWLFGRAKVCLLPPVAVRARFLD